MAELPTARLHPRDARDRLAVAGVHARRAARGAAEVARWLWGVSLVGAACVGAIMAIAAARPDPRPDPHEMSRTIQESLKRMELEHRLANELEIVEVPAPGGKGTIRSLARKRKPLIIAPAAAEPAVSEPAPTIPMALPESALVPQPALPSAP